MKINIIKTKYTTNFLVAIVAIFLIFPSCQDDEFGNMEGVVKNADGEPVGLASVKASTSSTTTDDLGTFLFTDLVPGPYTVNITHDDYKPFSQSVTITEGKNPMDFILTEIVHTAPTAVFSLSPQDGFLSVVFEADASLCTDEVDDTETLQVRWRWEPSDSFTEWSNVKTASHQYSTEGVKTVTLEVKNSFGVSSALSKDITVTANMSPEVQFTVSPTVASVNTDINIDASATTDDQTAANAIEFRWIWEQDATPTAWTTVNTGTYKYTSSGIKTITVEAKDESGATQSLEKTVKITENEDSNNDDYSMAQQISVSSIISGDIGYSSDNEDWFKVTIPYNGQFSVVIENLDSSSMGEAILYNSNIEQISSAGANGYISGNSTAKSPATEVYSGATYYIKIQKYNTESTFYNLSFELN